MGTRPNQKHGFTTDEIVRMCKLMDEDGGIIAMRDKANILLGFAGAFRGSEATSRDRHDDAEMPQHSLDLQHVKFNRFGVNIVIAKSKTDQGAAGLEVFVNHGQPTAAPVS